ncbi:MAG: Ni/Fe hydrogenase subunit alpha [Thiogranum sp.]|nr:Ni/Fe hydrogenase subunit alpha [Thiogranum sp.]
MTERKREVRIQVPVLTRVEGEGALDIAIHDQEITELRLRIFEPPRLFEKFLEGRDYQEVPDLVARICGICPVAYQMSAAQALENAFAVKVPAAVHEWRRLFYCGEWLQSHALHIHLLAAPDFLGFNSVTEMAGKYPDEVRRGLRLQTLGNDIMELLGARSVHPVGARIGGFHSLPTAEKYAPLLQRLRDAHDEARALVLWTAGLPLPDDEQDFCSVALHDRAGYGMYGDRLISSEGLNIAIDEYPQHFSEFQVPYSTALHGGLHGRPYLVGPLARLNLNAARLPRGVQEVIEASGVCFPSRNMFHSIVARAVEVLFAVQEATRILAAAPAVDVPYVEIRPRAGAGVGCTEAPRGILWHRYETGDDGRIRSARIVPPTSQNQARIEQDLRNALQAFGLDRDEPALRLHAETVIRNYDPCISCATHFLRLNIKRSPT